MNDKITKEEICEIYFDNQVKPKHLKEFTAVTPEGNYIEGYINKKPNRYLGSMYIHTLNDKPTSQFVFSMPKINYVGSDAFLSEKDEYNEYIAYEKLDGSCLILYPLLLNGGVVEVVPKTRNVPVADKFILNMYKLIDKKRIINFFKDNHNTTLLFELFGVLNRHEILYPKTYIDIRLIGATRETEILSNKELDEIADHYDFTRPFGLFHLISYKGKWRFYVCCECSDFYNYIPDLEVVYYPTQVDCIVGIADILQEANQNYYNEHGRIAVEGAVINGIDNETGRQLYVKIKPWDIIEKIKEQNGIPRRFILKEVRKYFDEYGSSVESIYEEDKNHYKKYVMDNLLEEFSDSMVNNKKTKNRIKKVFFDVWESRTPAAGLQEIAHTLIEKYPDASTTELMRKFAEEYPAYKNKARLIYSVIDSMKR